MPTVHSLPTEPIARLTGWDVATDRGARTVNADASATHYDPAGGHWAFAVADGIGDTPTAVSAARIAATVAARVAATSGPVEGILAAQRAFGVHDGGDAVLVVAVPGVGPSGFSCDVAWVGDCRAYQYNGRVLEQITVDHTVAQYYRDRSLPTTPRMDHLVTTSVRTARPELVGTTRTGFVSGRLLLSSDGVHKPLGQAGLRPILGRPGRIAATLVDTAHRFGGRDNATALVVEYGTGTSPVAGMAA